MEEEFRILVVDDEPIGRQLLEAVLFPEGYTILFAENGMEAYNKTKAEKPDLVMLDVMMPQMDGFETCKKIREAKDVSNTPVFLITALDDRDSRIRGLDAGADDYISKPFDRIEILAKVKNIKQNRKVTESITKQEESNSADWEKLIPLVLDSQKRIKFFNENSNFYSLEGDNCYNCALIAGYTNIGKYLVFFGSSFNNNVGQQLNLHLAIAIQTALIDFSSSANIDAVFFNLKSININPDEIGFYMALVVKDETAGEYKISAVNTSVFIKSQTFIKSDIIPGTNLTVNKNTRIALCTKELLNKINSEDLGAKIADLESGTTDFGAFARENKLSESDAIAIL